MKTYLKSILTIFTIMYLCCFSPSDGFSAEDLSHITDSGGTIYFAWDGEANSYDPDYGSGRFSTLGGRVSGREGDAATDCANNRIDTTNYHYTVISSEPNAQSSVNNSTRSLKTPYDGNCNNESTSRDRTVISLDSDKQEIYIRWYQKFTGNWMNGSIQHKLTKMTPLAHAGDDNYSTGYFTFRSNSRYFSLQSVNNVSGQFDGDGVSSRADRCVIYSNEASAGGQYDRVNRYWDNFNNELNNGSDGEYTFTTGVWYSIEIRIKVNSDESTEDAVAEMWIDGKKTFSLTGFRWYGPNDNEIQGVGYIELQHIYYNRATNDNQPTYIDNIVIANRYIGPVDSRQTQTIEPASNLTIVENTL